MLFERMPRTRSMISVFRRLQSVRSPGLAKTLVPTIPAWRTVYIWLLLVVVCPASFGLGSDRTIAQYVHTAWGQKEGAPGGILALAQTADGFLWLGCVDGLYRFDGVSFELRRPGITYALLALPNGDLWIGRKSAVSLLSNGQVTDYTVNDGVPAGKVASFAKDSEGVLWMATSAGLARLDGQRWKQVGADWNFNEAYATGMLLDRQGTFWVAAGHTILYLPRGSQQFHITGITTTQVWTLAQAPNGKLWMSETSRSVRPIPLDRDLPPSDKTEFVLGSIGFLFDREGALWITSIGQGMRRVASPERIEGRKFDRSDKLLESFTEADGLTDNLITAILEDREGNIWVGTNSGLDRFYKSQLVPVIVPFPAVGPVMAPGDKGSVWVDSIEHAFQIESSGQISTLTAKGKGYLDVYRGRDDALWWQRPGFLDRVDPGNVDWSRARSIPTPVDPVTKTHQALKITEDRNGVIWAASESAGVYTLSKDHWTRIENAPYPQGYRGSAAYTDWAGRVWLGFQDGTVVLFQDGRVKRNWSGRASPVGHVVASMNGRGRHIWLGGDTLAFFDGESFYEMTPADGQPFKVWAIEEVRDGSLWLCENRGVVHIPSAEVSSFLENHAHRVQYKLYNSLDGLPGSFHDAAPRTREILGSDGRIWFSSAKGIAWVNPGALSKNLLPPPVSIRELKADSERYSAPGVTLPPLTTALEIDYTALSLSILERVQFRYKLEGVDKDWQAAGTRRAAFYTRLGPGSYHFQVIACNNDGVWNETGAHLDFRIAPAWYQTNWFHIACAGALLVLMWGFYQLRLQQLRLEFNVRLEERVHERTRIARELHDTLLQSLHGLMFEFQAARNMFRKRPEEALQALDGAIMGTERAITEGQDAIENLRSAARVGEDLVQLVKMVGEDLVASQHPGHDTPTFGLTVEGQPRALTPLIQNEIYSIARELLRNAFRHAQAQRIEAEILYEEDRLRLRVRDNGKGMDPQVIEHGGRSGHWGLPGVRERAQQIGATLDLWSEAGAGTEIQLAVAASKAYQRTSGRSRFSVFRRSRSHERP
jgi:signal transduction histidine kinase/ligand-binding sensor domain-containing protein